MDSLLDTPLDARALTALYRDLVRTMGSIELQRDLDELGHSQAARLERLRKYLGRTFLKHRTQLEAHLDPADLSVLTAAADSDVLQTQLSYQIALQVQLRMPYQTARGTAPTPSVVEKLSQVDDALALLKLLR